MRFLSHHIQGNQLDDSADHLIPLTPYANSYYYYLFYFYGNPLQYSCLENPMDGGAW